MNRSATGKSLAAVTVALCLTGALFTLFPRLDLGASAAFFVDGTGFPLERSRAVQIVRDAVWDLSVLLTILSGLMMLIRAIMRPIQRISYRVWSFFFLAFLLGPGLLVNGILKEHWGRARPRNVEQFGGEAAFTPVLQISDECARNCSFVSGEAAGAVTLALVVALVVLPNLQTVTRRTAGVVLWGLAIAVSLSRVGFGGHFLSDVIMGGLLVSVLTLLLFLALRMETRIQGATPANALRDIGDLGRSAGALVRRMIGRR